MAFERFPPLLGSMIDVRLGFFGVDVEGNVFRRDGCASDWFGVGCHWLSHGRRVVHRFAYRSRSDI